MATTQKNTRLKRERGTLRKLTLVALFAAASGHASAASFTVDVQGGIDSRDGNPGDGFCVDDYYGDCSLRAAIMEVNALAQNGDSGPHTITFSGTQTLSTTFQAYDQNLVPDGHDYEGDLDIGAGYEAITGNILTPTTLTIDGSGGTINGNGVDRIFEVHDGVTLTLKNMTLTGGDTTWYTTQTFADGGAILAGGSDLLTDNVVIDNNKGVGSGGGVAYSSSVGDLTITNSTISNNRVERDGTSGSGGGVSSNGRGQTTITDSTISNNWSGGLGGGASVVALKMTRTVVSGNSANNGNSGGGVSMTGVNGASSWIIDSTITGNSAISGNGGGVIAKAAQPDSATLMTIERTLIEGNSARYGGGLALWAPVTLYLKNNTFTGNSAGVGGAIEFDTGTNGSYAMWHLYQNTIVDNEAGSDGLGRSGGVYAEFRSAPSRLQFAANILANSVINPDPDLPGISPDIYFYPSTGIDGDGLTDDIDPDDDNDCVADMDDAFPLDATESVDTDEDGVGNNADADDDNDKVVDTEDAFPLDPSESVDTDGDGIGNNADTDDDGDGVLDEDDYAPLDPSVTTDPALDTVVTSGGGGGGSFDLLLLTLLLSSLLIRREGLKRRSA